MAAKNKTDAKIVIFCLISKFYRSYPPLHPDSFCDPLASNTGALRNDNVDFVVSKGSVNNGGTISIVQGPN